MPQNYQDKQSGFSLMELVVSIAIFAILITGVLGGFAAVNQAVKVARGRIVLSSLATNYLEVVRNMPYSQVGTLSGNPHGSLTDLPNAITQTINGIKYKIYYKVAPINDPQDPVGPGNASYKQVKMSIANIATGQITDFITTVVPKGLISDPNTGALKVTVINSQGNPLPGASVNITYPTSSPYTFNLPDISNSSGQVTEVGLPAAANAYRVVATAPGYSTDQTVPIISSNPNPTHPDATIATGTVTQLTLSIDAVSTLNIKTLNSTCQPLSGVNLNIAGSKLIGNSPDVIKYNNNFSSAGGAINLNNIEWDTYTPVLLTGQSVIAYGTSPIQKISVLPGTTQTFTMILGPNSTANSLLVIVKDAATGIALENAAVTLSLAGNPLPTEYTGGSVWLQNNWASGSGQAQWSAGSPSGYFADNGNIDVSSAGQVKLQKIGNSYTTATGTLESSTFDTGTGATNYTILSWLPLSQSASTTLEFQVAANNDNATWNYVGPDATPDTYFTTPGQDMGSTLDNNRYVRYKAYLATSNPAITPVLTSVSVNFVTGCFTPGQVIFTGLSTANYSLNVSLPGYADQNISNINVSDNQPLEVDMNQ